ncbi:MAG: AAA family ATPase [Candidatus Midichloria sp.]|nr:AAA family ATPase [Candidatus Midichloria sp.]
MLVGVFNPIKGDFSSGSLNNVKVYDMMSYTFKDDFSFSQTEVSELITKFSLEQEVKERIQQWYNRYNTPAGDVDSIKIYNSLSIIKYLSDVLADPELKPKNYWVHSGSQPALIKILNIGLITHLKIRLKL